MKILYILEDGRLGGMNKMILDIAAGLRSYDIETKVIIGKANSEATADIAKAHELNIEKVDIRYLSRSFSSVLLYLGSFVFDLYKLIRIVNHFKPDIVYCNGSQHIKGVIASKLIRKNVVWHMHDTYQPKAVLLLFRTIRRVFSVRNFVASCKRTIYFYQLSVTDTLVSIPPVNTKDFSPDMNRSHPDPKTVYQIISVANVNPDKGIETLVRTAAKVNQVRNDVRFLVVGLIPENQAQLFGSVQALQKELGVNNLVFLGQRSDIKRLLSESDLYLCSSDNESGPISVFEAMAMAIPVVSTDVGDLKEIFSINKSATVQPVKDSTSLANEIVYLLKNDTKRKERGANGRLTAEQHLDIQHTIEKHVTFYKALATT